MSEEADELQESGSGLGSMFARDEAGRFAPKESPEAEPVAQEVEAPKPEPEAPAKPAAEEPAKAEQPASVPLATFLEVQNRLKEAERNRKTEAPPQQIQPPSFYDNPDEFLAYQEQQRENDKLALRIEMSARFASQQHGAEALEAAREWGAREAAADPTFSQRFGAQPDPVGWLVSQHKQSELLGQVGADPDAYVRKRALELGFVEQAAQAQPVPQSAAPVVQPAPTPAPPRSLASQPNAGASETYQPVGIGAMYKP